MAARLGVSRSVFMLFFRFKHKAFRAFRLPLWHADAVFSGRPHLSGGLPTASCFCICFFDESSAVFRVREHPSVSGMPVRDRSRLSRRTFSLTFSTCGLVAASRYTACDASSAVPQFHCALAIIWSVGTPCMASLPQGKGGVSQIKN